MPMDMPEFYAEGDMHTLLEAERINANPKRVAQAKNVAKEKARMLMKFAGEAEDSSPLKDGFTKIG